LRRVCGAIDAERSVQRVHAWRKPADFEASILRSRLRGVRHGLQVLTPQSGDCGIWRGISGYPVHDLTSDSDSRLGHEGEVDAGLIASAYLQRVSLLQIRDVGIKRWQISNIGFRQRLTRSRSRSSFAFGRRSARLHDGYHVVGSWTNLKHAIDS